MGGAKGDVCFGSIADIARPILGTLKRMPARATGGHMKKETALKAASLQILIGMAEADQPLV
jgi:hypothetical protein